MAVNFGVKVIPFPAVIFATYGELPVAPCGDLSVVLKEGPNNKPLVDVSNDLISISLGAILPWLPVAPDPSTAINSNDALSAALKAVLALSVIACVNELVFNALNPVVAATKLIAIAGVPPSPGLALPNDIPDPAAGEARDAT